MKKAIEAGKMSDISPVKSAIKIGAVTALALLSPACGGETSSTSGGDEAASRNSTQAEIENKIAKATGPDYAINRVSDPCSLVTEAVARNLLKVREVVANPANSGPESTSPRCAYRDAESLGKSVSIVAVQMPYAFFNSTMATDELRTLVNQNFGEPDMAFEVADFGAGAQRFVATSENTTTMFVMSGLGVAGGAYEPDKINAEAAFAVTLTDPERSEDERLSEVRNLAMAYNSNMINAAKPR